MAAADPARPAGPVGAAPEPGAREVILQTRGLTKRFGRRVAVNDLDLEVRRGEVYGLLGPNGSGKTTTLRMIVGLVWPTAGEVSAFGGSMAHPLHRQASQRRLGAVIDQPAFYPYLSGQENLLAAAVYGGMPINRATRARVCEVLGHVGLEGTARVAYRRYSLGMRQRLGIAAALLARPELVVLDEPTNGLDPEGMVDVRALIGQLARERITVVLASHLLHEVQQVCGRVAILREGRLVAEGNVADMVARQRGVQLGFAQAEQLARAVGVLQAAAAEHPWLRGAQYVPPEPGAWSPPGGWLLLIDAPAERAADLNAILGAHDLSPAELRRRETTLEQFYLELLAPQPEADASAAAPTRQGVA